MAQILWLCPGLLGTALVGRRGQLSVPIYPSPAGLATYGFRSLRLDTVAQNPPELERLVGVVGPGDPLPYFYDELLRAMRETGYRVIPASLDWRLSLFNQATTLAAAIMGTPPADQSALVCHSMGGLVAALAYGRLADQGQAARVNRIITLGTPWWGSYTAVAALCGWETWYKVMRSLQGAVWGLLLSDIVARGNISAPLASWPSVYQLMPNPLQPASNDPQRSSIYTAENLGKQAVVVDMTRVTPLVDFWPLVVAGTPPAAKTVPVIGTGHRTAYAWKGGQMRTAGGFLWGDGDGVVAAGMATPGSRPSVQLAASHGSIVYEPAVLSALKGWVDNGIS